MEEKQSFIFIDLGQILTIGLLHALWTIQPVILRRENPMHVLEVLHALFNVIQLRLPIVYS